MEIFKYDPVAYRFEPLVCPNTPTKPVLMLHHKGRKRLHIGTNFIDTIYDEYQFNSPTFLSKKRIKRGNIQSKRRL